MPIELDPQAAPDTPPSARGSAPDPTAANEEEVVRLLLIDDEPSVVNALRRSLRREGYRIFTATSPEEGMRLIGEERADIVISDHLMPEMTGIELFTIVSRLHPQVRRVVLTGQADVDMAIRAINEGHVHRFLTKPWDDDELKHILRETAREIIVQRRQARVKREVERSGAGGAPRHRSIQRDASGAIVIDELVG